AIRNFNHQALEAFVVELLAVGIQHADAPGDLLLAEELALQHTERPGLTRLRALHHIAFEEQLARLLTLRRHREAGSPEQREQGPLHQLHDITCSDSQSTNPGCYLSLVSPPVAY